MGKMKRYDPQDEYHQLEYYYPHQQSSKTTSSSVKGTNNKMSVKKSVKITYISSPLLVRTCDASEFRSVVQQLTGKDSPNDLIISENINNHHPHKAPNYWSNIHQDQPATTSAASWIMQLQEGGDHHHHHVPAAAMSSSKFFDDDDDDGNGSLSCYDNNNNSRAVVELEEDFFWKQAASRSVLQSPFVV